MTATARATRIAVAIRKGLTAADGSALPVTAGFRAVLDDRGFGHARLDAARPRLRDAIAALEAAGVPRADLVVAWDFTVADDASAYLEHAVSVLRQDAYTADAEDEDEDTEEDAKQDEGGEGGDGGGEEEGEGVGGGPQG